MTSDFEDNVLLRVKCFIENITPMDIYSSLSGAKAGLGNVTPVFHVVGGCLA